MCIVIIKTVVMMWNVHFLNLKNKVWQTVLNIHDIVLYRYYIYIYTEPRLDTAYLGMLLYFFNMLSGSF